MTLFRTLAAAAVAMIVAGMACAQTVGIGTGPAGSLTNNLGAVIAGVATQGTGLEVRAQPYDESQQHFALTSSGDLAFSLGNIQELRAAINGTEQSEDSGLPNMRAVARLIDIRVGLFVRADSGINSISELRGKRVPVGYGSQATERYALIALLAAGGLTTSDVVGVEVQNMDEGAAAFLEGQVGAMMSFVLDPALLRNSEAVGGITRSKRGIKMLEIPDDPDAVAAMTTAFSGASIVTTNTFDGRPGFEREHGSPLPYVDHPTRTMAYDILIAASTETDEELVYKVVKTLAANKNAFLVTGEPQYLSFSKDTMATQYDGVEYHPGAIRYYREMGIWPSN
ncbi:TAXI family TRAP transporter solute-binding subunit [Actibacterium sp. MT2.3-13A]|uniref:TAXI family TRAP transporter solute-binding subunit n=1 Tax=Actibacterium sp. MT2.3-13A TaxID=2828332 RepID=UPI001BA52B11|nr:TAXI family TRAP transporter solute-binding subunit [Actibacterium sp. MT2.3-13A]